MKRITLFFMILVTTPVFAGEIEDKCIYNHYLDKCMNEDPSDFAYCACVGRCMKDNTDEIARQYFENDWYNGHCKSECDNWYNNVYRNQHNV